jgi:hypothetical protein
VRSYRSDLNADLRYSLGRRVDVEVVVRTEVSTGKGYLMIAYQSTLLGRTEVAEETMSFHFEKPLGFLFKAGQYI